MALAVGHQRLAPTQEQARQKGLPGCRHPLAWSRQELTGALLQHLQHPCMLLSTGHLSWVLGWCVEAAGSCAQQQPQCRVQAAVVTDRLLLANRHQ